MHAYRDAIRRSAGAYIIYPGTQRKYYRGYHEILPGLGAFPLRPYTKDQDVSEIRAFLEQVVNHLCKKISARAL